MILELTYARGMCIWLDGRKPDSSLNNAGWSMGESDDALKLSENDGSPLKVGPHKVVGLGSNVPFNGCGDNVPTELTLLFADREPIKLAVTHYAYGNPEAEGPVVVRLSNGETIVVDEITLFLRASEGTLINVAPERLTGAPRGIVIDAGLEDKTHDVDQTTLKQYLMHRVFLACAEAGDRINLNAVEAVINGDEHAELWREMVETDFGGNDATAFNSLRLWASSTHGPSL